MWNRQLKLASKASLSLLLVFLLLSCADDTDSYFDQLERMKHIAGLPQGIVVRNSDYLSSAISALDPEQANLHQDRILDSGSSSAGLSLMLSGDVVFPSSALPTHEIVLIDRYPNSVLTFLHPINYKVLWQHSVATGFASNPHDLVWVRDRIVYVTRYQKNLTPGREEFDSGDDLLIVDLEQRKTIGRIGLENYSGSDDPKSYSRPERAVLAFGSVWVSLGRLNHTFDHAQAGALLRIDPQTDEVLDLFEEPSLANCSDIAVFDREESLLVTCSGLYSEGREKQIERSGLWKVSKAGSDWKTEVVLRASQIGQPVSAHLTLGSGWIFFIGMGELGQGKTKDTLWSWIGTKEPPKQLFSAKEAYTFGQILFDSEVNWLYLCDADPKDPHIILFTVESDAITYWKSIDSSPSTGLPPREIAFY